MDIPELLYRREIGWGRGAFHASSTLRRHISASRIASIGLDATGIASPHRAPVRWLDIDLAESRYLLSAGSDGTIAAWDIAPEVGHPGGEPVFVVNKETHPRTSHMYSATVAMWHALDTETFFSAGMDNKVRTMQPHSCSIPRHPCTMSQSQYVSIILHPERVKHPALALQPLPLQVKCWDSNELEILLEFDAGTCPHACMPDPFCRAPILVPSLPLGMPPSRCLLI